ISIHIEIPCSCKSEEDGLLLSCLLALHSLINRHLDRMAALRRRKNSFHACELLCCLEYGRLLYRARFHISVMVELGQYRTHAVLAKTHGMVCVRNKSACQRINFCQRAHHSVITEIISIYASCQARAGSRLYGNKLIICLAAKLF